MSDKDLVGIVTGGASGIGLGIVRHLLQRDYAIVAMDRDKAACDEASKMLESCFSVTFVPGDVANSDDVRRCVGVALENHGHVDLLCNNAGIHPSEALECHSVATWQDTFRVNVEGPLLCTQMVLKSMKRRRSGTIVNIGSISGISPYVNGGAYAASKAALSMMTRVLALEVGPYGITANCICPGSIRKDADQSDGDLAAAHLPIGRYGKPNDVAQMVVYLASPAGSYITGTVIVLDGGATAGRSRERR